MYTDMAATQLGYLDPEMLEIVDLIHQFTTSADFADWITDGNFKNVILDHKLLNGEYKRLYQYELNGDSFFNGKTQIETENLPKEIIHSLNEKLPIATQNPVFSEVSKSNISRVIAEPFYTVISQCFHRKAYAGMVWEIYNLEQLVKIYKTKKDPLRRWRNTRRD